MAVLGKKVHTSICREGAKFQRAIECIIKLPKLRVTDTDRARVWWRGGSDRAENYYVAPARGVGAEHFSS